MVTGDFTNFFLAATGAGAALIGLLFVAISIRPGLAASRATQPAAQISVAMAFTALVNGFFISFAALLPRAFIGDIALFMGTLSSWSCLTAAVSLLRQHSKGPPNWSGRLLARGLVLVAVGLLIYGWEIAAGWQAVQAPKDIGPVFTIATLVIAVFGLGLVRAWELLGARTGSGLLPWLSPLGDDDVLPPQTTADEARSRDADADRDSATESPQ
jgi:hypothetical protein